MWFIPIAVISFALNVSGCKKGDGDNSIYNVSDSVFVSKASMANFAEITAGQIAADSALDPSIAQFGEMMVSEHTMAQQQLQSIASQLGISISNTLDQEHQMFVDSLLDLKGRAFDSVYIHRQVVDHEKVIDFFKNESGHGLQKDIKSYMYLTLRNVTMHLTAARTLAQNY
jgi:putative membrane protein